QQSREISVGSFESVESKSKLLHRCSPTALKARLKRPIKHVHSAEPKQSVVECSHANIAVRKGARRGTLGEHWRRPYVGCRIKRDFPSPRWRSASRLAAHHHPHRKRQPERDAADARAVVPCAAL